MYKILLVDDEIDVREGLLEEVDWQEHGFVVAGTAENGREALEQCSRLEPDVVITDISMPFMDGLKLAAWLREHHPLVKIIILTGYDEFDYARQAVTLSVDEYLLKPFSSGQLSELLVKIRSKIEAEIAEREDIRQLKQHYYNSLPVLKETFLASLLTRKLSEETIRERTRNLNLDLQGSHYAMQVIQLHAPDPQDGIRQEHSLYYSDDTDLRLFSVRNIAEEVWEGKKLGNVFLYQDYIVLLSIKKNEAEQHWLSSLQEALEGIIRSVQHYLKLKVTIGAGSPARQLSEVKESYDEAVMALDYRLVLGRGRLIYIQDVENRTTQKLRQDELKEQALIRCLKVGTEEELEEAITDIFADISELEHSYKDIQVYLMGLLTAVLKTAKDADVNFDQWFGPGTQLYMELFRFQSLPEARQWFADRCGALMQQLSSRRQHAYREIIEKAVSYMKANYQSADISIQQVCSHLHISTGYFSFLFKKEVKMTFVQYLMQLRMEAARELLRATELRAFEVAEQVGFADANYFSFCFKKQTGASPKEYRNKISRMEADVNG
ncbi:response regulator [Paenibacillus pinihumi]|uniref:response regulator n=1 Tax=Paenibacillus pinihumi TaxID=669462 RepID=UPI0003FC1ED4|nr:response regulator [Paenibacillus pinihumi]